MNVANVPVIMRKLMPNFFFQWPGELGIHQTVHMMRNLVNQTYTHPWIRERAEDVTEGCERNKHCDHETLTNWVTSKVRYLEDPTGVEALHHPLTFYEKRLRQGIKVWGDCDDMAMYLATLLKSIGHKPEFRIVGRNKTFHHILVICEGENLDPTMGIGNYPRNPGRAMRVPI